MVFYFICFWFGKILGYIPLSILFPTKVLGKENLPKNHKVIVCCNHLSWVDILLLWFKVPGFRRFLAKKEVGQWHSRMLVRATGTIFINREGNDIKAVKKCIAVLKSGQSLNIFPEGTRNKVDTSLQPLQSGVAMFVLKGNATVVPIMIKNKSKIFKRNIMQIGKPIKFDHLGETFNKANTTEVMTTIREAMLETRAMLN